MILYTILVKPFPMNWNIQMVMMKITCTALKHSLWQCKMVQNGGVKDNDLLHKKIENKIYSSSLLKHIERF